MVELDVAGRYCACSHVEDEHEMTPTGIGGCTVAIVDITFDYVTDQPQVGRLACPCSHFEHDPEMGG